MHLGRTRCAPAAHAGSGSPTTTRTFAGGRTLKPGVCAVPWAAVTRRRDRASIFGFSPFAQNTSLARNLTYARCAPSRRSTLGALALPRSEHPFMPSPTRQVLVAVLAITLAGGIVTAAVIGRGTTQDPANGAQQTETAAPGDPTATTSSPPPRAQTPPHPREQPASEQDIRRRAVSEPVVNARVHLSRLRLLLADAVIGADRDDEHVLEAISQRAAWIGDAAQRLDDPVDGQPSEAPSGDPLHAPEAVARVVPVVSRWDVVANQRDGLSEQLRDAADTAVEVADAAVRLRAAAHGYAAAVDELPSGDDPAVLRDAWRDERERLTEYREVAQEAGTRPALTSHADAHMALTDVLLDLTDEAIDAIDADDLDAYNQLVEQLPTQVAGELRTIEATLEDALVAAVEAIDTTTARANTLLNTLRVLEVTPA